MQVQSQTQKRKLGNSGFEVAPLAFGGNIFGWTVDDATAFHLLDAFVDAGFNLIDTADVYSRWAPGNHGGESEIVIGKWLKRSGKRGHVVVATKVGMEMDPTRKGLSKSYILSAAEESLRRLQVDCIDLYQSHVDDANSPLEETLAAYAQLVQQGKVRAVGASNYKADRLKAANEVSLKNNFPRYQSLQPHYNLYERSDYEANLEPVCGELALGVIPYFSLASGFLTGKYRSEADFGKSKRGPRMNKYLNDRGLRILASLDHVAEQHQATPAQVALGWLMARPSITAPIASATSLQQLDELIGATRLKLDPESMEELNQASQ